MKPEHPQIRRPFDLTSSTPEPLKSATPHAQSTGGTFREHSILTKKNVRPELILEGFGHDPN